MYKKIVALVLGMSLSLMTFSACGADESAVQATVTEESIPASGEQYNEGEYVTTTLSTDEANILVYYPVPNQEDESSLNLTCTAPVFLVFGNEEYTDELADTWAKETGLYSIAAENGSSICFVNPVDATYSDKNEQMYMDIVDLIDDSSSDERSNGISSAVDYMTGDTIQKITGTSQRVYVYGIDEGADYVANNLLTKLVKTVYYEPTVGIDTNVSIAAASLEGLRDVTKLESNDLPVVSIGNTDEVNQKLKEACSSVLVDESVDYVEDYNSVVGTVRRQNGVLIPMIDYEAEGIVESIESYTVTTSEDNAGTYAGTDSHPVNVVVYYDNSLDVKEGEVPLVLCFHGGGNTALYEAEATQWPLIGKENGFITVSVDSHFPDCSATEIVDLIEQIEEKYSIDKTRIYASGFSMGGVKSWDLFEQYPEVFAGLAPMDASADLGTDSWGNAVTDANSDIIVPVFYVGGETSPLPELPCQAERLIDRVNYVFSVNDVVANYTEVEFDAQDSWINPIWGIDGDSSYTVMDDEYFTDSTLTVQLFKSSDGNTYTALASASNQSHEVYARNSWAAWDFLSKFVRNEDGSISIVK